MAFVQLAGQPVDSRNLLVSAPSVDESQVPCLTFYVVLRIHLMPLFSIGSLLTEKSPQNPCPPLCLSGWVLEISIFNLDIWCYRLKEEQKKQQTKRLVVEGDFLSCFN